MENKLASDLLYFFLGVGAAGKGGARAGASTEDGADSSGETGATCTTLRPQSRHEGDVAEREPAACLTGRKKKTSACVFVISNNQD